MNEDEPLPALRAPLLFLTVLAIATCGLIYELVAGTLASYLLGDSVTQFSTVIGVYLSAMGLGSYLSRYINKGLAYRFIDIELAVALVGGASAPILFLSFAATEHFRLILYSLVTCIGALVGLEIPLLMRILRHEFAFKDLIAQVLTFDYIGALIASLLFPLLLMPHLGLNRTSLLFGLLNALVGLASTWLLQSQLGATTFLRVRCLLVIALLGVGIIFADKFTARMEHDLYAGELIFAKSSPYQRIVITRHRDSFQLFLNGNLQFNSIDEYRYHEALVHPAFSVHPEARRILVCGGGDGLAVREILTYTQVEEVVVVDLDPLITELAANMPLLRNLNANSLRDPRVHVINEDAMIWLQNSTHAPFDMAIVDFPDPNSYALGKLYTTRFYHLLEAKLSANGIAVIQSTSPLFARTSFWCIVNTVEAVGFTAIPYHLTVPSFGIWGFVIVTKEPREKPTKIKSNLRFLNDETLHTLFIFPRDMQTVETEVNRLNNQVLVHYYEAELKKWF